MYSQAVGSMKSGIMLFAMVFFDHVCICFILIYFNYNQKFFRDCIIESNATYDLCVVISAGDEAGFVPVVFR